jgi:transcriptional regulator with XRE-family HTH domain
MFLSELGQRIRSQREKRGLKQIDIAHALQISPQAVSKWERGENAPDITMFIPLARILDVSIDWLMGSFTLEQDVFEATVFASGVQVAREKSASMKPRDFAAWSNGFCYQISESVLRFGGIPVKYMGPGMLSFFSGVNHAGRAVEAALHAIDITSESLKIALSTGEVYLGAMGHPDYMHTDIMGEAVSVALLATDWAADNTGSGMVVTDTTFKTCNQPLTTGKSEAVKFSGIEQLVQLHEVAFKG